MSDAERRASSDSSAPRSRSRARSIVGLVVVTLLVIAAAVVWALGSSDVLVTVSLNLLMFVLIAGALVIPALLLGRYTRADEPEGTRSLGLFVEGLRGKREDQDGRRPGD